MYTVYALKQSARKHHQGSNTHVISYTCTDTTPIRSSAKVFISSIQTKDSAPNCKSFQINSLTVIVSNRDGVTTNIVNLDVSYISFNHEEADTILMLHDTDFVKQDSIKAIHILSIDTDVLVLALSYFSKVGTRSLYGNWTCTRKVVQLRPIYDKLGPSVADALIIFHCFTGCDSTGRFSGKGKITCWKYFCKSNSNIVKGFCDLGELDEPSQKTAQSLHEYVCYYCIYQEQH